MTWESPFCLLTPLFSVILCAGSTEKSVPLLLRRGHANLLCIVPILVYVLPLSEHVYSPAGVTYIFVLSLCCAHLW